jgi:hypothetical protein
MRAKWLTNVLPIREPKRRWKDKNGKWDVNSIAWIYLLGKTGYSKQDRLL